eukprot:scaffold16146_cov116-Cyclotella_meneghiniana.AAC.1
MSKRCGRSVTMVQRERADGEVDEARTQEEVEHMIWEEIHGKRFYLAEQAPICKGRLRGDFGYMANTRSAQSVLSGTYEYPDDIHQGTKDILEEIGEIRSIVPKNSVSTDLRRPAWKEKWRGSKEKTSSSLSGLHFGHYIAGSSSEVISHHHSLKATICLKRGFAIDRWKGAYGDSKGCAQSKIEIKYQGLCQGNGAAPAGWAVISITVLRAHKKKGHGATFMCPISKIKSTLAAI